MYLERQVVEQVRESDPVFCSHWLSDNDLVDVIKLVPVFIPTKHDINVVSKQFFFSNSFLLYIHGKHVGS